MKKISEKTTLCQGNKFYLPRLIDEVVYWIDEKAERDPKGFYTDGSSVYHDEKIMPPENFERIVAQSIRKLYNVPVICMNRYVEFLAQKNNESGEIVGSIKRDINEQILITGARIVGYKECYERSKNQYTYDDLVNAAFIGISVGRSSKVDENYTGNQAEEVAKTFEHVGCAFLDEKFNIMDIK
jgi:hypothetical protein